MRAGRPSLALAAFVFWPFACAVYNDESLGLGLAGGAPIDNSAGGTSAGAAAKGGDANSGKSGGGAQAGSAASGGTAAETVAGSGGGGDTPSVGGEGSADGGEASGGSANGGKGGAGGSSAGAGGKAGAGGSGGAPTTAGAGGKGGSGGNAGSAGAAGSGGGPSIPVCNDHPLTARSSWTASASHPTTGADVPANLLDGKITRWSTGKAQSGDEWLQIDFGTAVTINHVNLQQGDDTNDYPRGYSVIVSNTAKDLNGTVRNTGSGKSGVSTAILLPALATGRYLLLKQTSSSLSWWSAEEIEVSCSD